MDPRADARVCPDSEIALVALPSFHGLLPTLPPQLITAGKRRDCVRMRGLQYEAAVNDIVTFLGDHSRQIVTQGVHLIYSAEVCIHTGCPNKNAPPLQCFIVVSITSWNFETVLFR